MADPQTGMDRADMKKLLTVSKREPVHCAVGQGKDAAFALLLMDKIKSGKALEAAMIKEFPEAKNRGFGTAVVDTDEDPKLAKFTLNKAPGGTARRIHKTLKGTGFSKVIIVDEEGQPLDSHVGEEEEEGQGAAAPAAPSQPAAAAPPPPPPPPGAPPSNAAMLEKALAAMVPGIPTAAAGRQDVQKQLVTLAQQAQAGIKGGDLNAAAAAITALRTALAAASNAGAGGSAPSSAPTDAGAAAGAVAYGKSRLAWLAARQKVISDIEKLRAEIVATYQDDGIAPELESSYKATVQPIIDQFDTELADDLDAAVNATDPAKRGELVGQAKATIDRYQKFLDGEPLIADLDDNPFVPLSIHATISNTLAALSKTLR